MTFINYASREINCKICYYGPGLCGKNDNLQFIYERAEPNAKGKLTTLATETDCTLFFDFLPRELGNVRGFKTRFHLYTVPGQVFYDASRKLLFKGVDGVIFVADSQRERMEANAESLRDLKQNLQAQGYDLRSIPYVLQLNKRDSPTAVPVDQMMEKLRIGDEPVVEAIAHSEEGIGVFDTLKAVAKLVLQDLTKVEPNTRESATYWQGRSRGTTSSPAAATEPRLTQGARNAPFEIKFDGGHGSLVHDLLGVLQFPVAFLVASSLFLDPGATQHLAVNVAYWVMGFAGALWIHHRNERQR
jgi:signal recognition particle receptor subunit beta